MFTTDKVLEGLNIKLDSLSSMVKNKLSFNKMIETQIAQIAAAIPIKSDAGGIPGQPETSLESVNMISTRLGNPCPSWGSFPVKKGDPGRPTITIGIGPHTINNVYCDLGASINMMAKVTYEKVLGGPLSPASFQLQMADQTTRKVEGVAEDILIRLKDEYVPIDFVILDMGDKVEVPLILGRLFLHTSRAAIYVEKGIADFHIRKKTVRLLFNGYPRPTEDKKIKPKTRPEPSLPSKQVWRVKTTPAPVSPGADVSSSLYT
jgi:hypothetical protein